MRGMPFKLSNSQIYDFSLKHNHIAILHTDLKCLPHMRYLLPVHVFKLNSMVVGQSSASFHTQTIILDLSLKHNHIAMLPTDLKCLPYMRSLLPVHVFKMNSMVLSQSSASFHTQTIILASRDTFRLIVPALN